MVLIHCRPSLDFTPVFSHGFSPTVHRAHVTANGGDDGRDLRILRQLSVQGGAPEPAAVVYNRWAGGYFDHELQRARALCKGDAPVVILDKSSEFPLGVSGSTLSEEASREGGQLPSDGPEREQPPAVNEASPHEDAFTCSSSVLLHPAFIHQDLSLSVFARAPVGTEVCLPAQLSATARS